MLPSSIAITVAGTASPSGVKICVMPAFVPNIPSDGTPARAETLNLRLLLEQQRVCPTQGKERPITAVCMVADMFGSVQRDYSPVGEDSARRISPGWLPTWNYWSCKPFHFCAPRRQGLGSALSNLKLYYQPKCSTRCHNPKPHC